MPKIILNELNYVKDVLNSENASNIDITFEQMMYLFAKYYYDNIMWHTETGEVLDKPDVFINTIDKDGNEIQKVDKDKMREAVEIMFVHIDEQFQRLNWNDYYTFKYSKQVHNACEIVIKYDLHLKVMDSISLKSDELENIRQCDTDQEKKLLFACYIYSRYRDKKGRIDDDIVKKTIFDMANIKGSKLEKNKLIKRLVDKSFLSQNYLNNNITLWVTPGNGEDVYSVDNLENLGHKIFVFLHDDYIACEVCDIPVKRKSNRDYSTKYCKKHAYETKLNQVNECKQRKKDNLE